MLFVLSKVLWFLMQPSTLLMALVVAGVALSMWPATARRGRRLAATGLVLLLIAGLSPLASLLLVPLETRFPRIQVADRDPAYTGIILLGGAEDGRLSALKQQLHVNEAAERIIEGALLARRLPVARIVLTGGAANLVFNDPEGSTAVATALRGLGVDSKRILVEPRSRNTYENAVFTRDLVRPKAGERWLLITSAAHMPRSMGLFRKAGFAVTAYPVDYRTSGPDELLRPFGSLPAGLRRLDESSREWVGLFVQYVLGQSDEFLPGP